VMNDMCFFASQDDDEVVGESYQDILKAGPYRRFSGKAKKNKYVVVTKLLFFFFFFFFLLTQFLIDVVILKGYSFFACCYT
jgi:hypothetical protein